MTAEQRTLMIQSAMIASSLSTMLQLYPIKIGNIQIGAGLPIVMGTSNGFIPALTLIGAEYGLTVIIGSVIAACFLEIIIALNIKFVKKLFPPVVIGSVLMAFGLSLMPIGVRNFVGGAAAENAYRMQMNLIATGQEIPAHIAALASQFASPQNLILGGIVLLTILLIRRFAKGVLKVSAMVAGITVGYITAIIMGQINFAPIAAAGIISLPKPLWIMPEFHILPILSLLVMFIVTAIETIGDANGVTIGVFDREATAKETQGALLADAFGTMFAALIGTLPNTSYGQNTGIVTTTKVVNKFCVFVGACVLLLAGLCPKLGALFSVMPASVLGGAIITVFAVLMINGVKMIARAGFSERNVLIVALTFGLGYSVSAYSLLVSKLPSSLNFLFSSPLIAVCIVSMLLNILFPPTPEDKQKAEESEG
jgi:NCS2 family nucleobase:cation symporter-2